MVKVTDVGQRDGGEGRLIYEQAGSRSFTCSTPPLASLEKEWPLQAGSNLTVDHHHRASRTTETQQKGKSWSDQDI